MPTGNPADHSSRRENDHSHSPPLGGCLGPCVRPQDLSDRAEAMLVRACYLISGIPAFTCQCGHHSHLRPCQFLWSPGSCTGISRLSELRASVMPYSVSAGQVTHTLISSRALQLAPFGTPHHLMLSCWSCNTEASASGRACQLPGHDVSEVAPLGLWSCAPCPPVPAGLA